MNLAPLLLLAMVWAQTPSDPEALYEEGEYVYTGGEYHEEVFRYRLLKPPMQPGEKYPVVLFLHGAGERGDDNRAQLKYLPSWLAEPENRQRYPCWLIAPQCRQGKLWVDVPFRTAKFVMPEEPSDQMRVALGILERILKEPAADPNRVYLTGLSMGGYGCWDLAIRYPDKFAAVAPICGGGDPTRAERLVHVPVWAWHGAADRAVPVERSREMIEAIRQAGGDPKYTELEGVGHDSWTPAYRDPEGLLPWMFAQVRKE
jgi:predicted peptidase